MSTFEDAEQFVETFYNNNLSEEKVSMEDFKAGFRKNMDVIETLHDVERIGLKTMDTMGLSHD